MVTVPDSVIPLTEPVVPTDVTVPVLEVLALKFDQSVEVNAPVAVFDAVAIPIVTLPDVPPPVIGDVTPTPVISPCVELLTVTEPVLESVVNVTFVPPIKFNVSLFEAAVNVVCPDTVMFLYIA